MILITETNNSKKLDREIVNGEVLGRRHWRAMRQCRKDSRHESKSSPNYRRKPKLMHLMRIIFEKKPSGCIETSRPTRERPKRNSETSKPTVIIRRTHVKLLGAKVGNGRLRSNICRVSSDKTKTLSDTSTTSQRCGIGSVSKW